MNLDDGRISKFHRQIYDWVSELYPNFTIEMEKVIPSTNQRIDIFIELLNLAIECDGTFHDNSSSFFVKDEFQWQDIVQRDKKKESMLEEHGIKLVRIPYNHKLKSSKDLVDYIDSIDYPDIPYDSSIFKEKNKDHLEFARKIRKEQYSQYIKENRERIKYERKKRYLESKNNR